MEIMKPIAAPSIGGMVTSTLHVLFMTPCLFVIGEDIRRWWRPSPRRGHMDAAGVRLGPLAVVRWRRLDRNIEVGGVDDAVALELHPHAIHARTREDQIELHLGAAVGDERMRVHHVDQVVAGGQHVTPRAEIFLEAVAGSRR